MKFELPPVPPSNEPPKTKREIQKQLMKKGYWLQAYAALQARGALTSDLKSDWSKMGRIQQEMQNLRPGDRRHEELLAEQNALLDALTQGVMGLEG